MSTELTNVLSEALAVAFNDHSFVAEVGDLIVYGSSGIFRVTGIVANGPYSLVVYAVSEGEEEQRNVTLSGRQLSECSVFKGTLAELNAEVTAHLLSGPKKEKLSTSTEVATSSNAADLEATKRTMAIEANRLTCVEKRLSSLMDKKRWELLDATSELRDKIKKIEGLLHILGLYEGMGEEVVTLQEGAITKQPLHILQQLYYMDLEVGDPTNGGYDITNLEDFDRWLVQEDKYYGDKNYERLLPYPCCIAAVKIRQNAKRYSPNEYCMITIADLEEANKSTYFLFRNGDKIQRYSANMEVRDRLFPLAVEYDELLEKAKEKSFFDTERFIKKHEKDTLGFKFNFLVLQSVVERLPIFDHVKHIKFFSPSILESESVVFVRNDENIIDDGEAPWHKLKKELTSNLKEGDRVYLLYPKGEAKADLYYNEFHWDNSSYPEPPEPGVYTVYEDTDQKCLYLKVTPRDRVSVSREEYLATGVSTRLRKNKLRMKIRTSDDYVVPYDFIEEKHMSFLNHMMHSRKNRVGSRYLVSVKQLKTVYDARREELDYEKHFIELVKGEFLGTAITSEDIAEALSWWKNKNKWKRSLHLDEAKALRMVVGKLKGRLYGRG